MAQILSGRTSQLKTYIEPLLAGLFTSCADQVNLGVSDYIRTLVIEELRTKGVLTDKLLADLATGRTKDANPG